MFIISLSSEKNNAIVFWQSEGARYARVMCLFLIPDIPIKHADILYSYSDAWQLA